MPLLTTFNTEMASILMFVFKIYDKPSAYLIMFMGCITTQLKRIAKKKLSLHHQLNRIPHTTHLNLVLLSYFKKKVKKMRE